MSLYAPTDVDAAYESWGANCGPCSLAAILGREVETVRPFVNGFDKRRYMNPTHMQAALDAAGVKHHARGPHFPEHGLAFIQWKGPWTQPYVPVHVQYRHTHWLAVDGTKVYDINADASWVERSLWEKAMPVLMREAGEGHTGEWYVRTGIEVEW